MEQTIGERIKNNLSQQELSDKVNISKSQINRYENRGSQPPADTLNKLSDILNTSVDFLINGNQDEKAKATLKNNELLNKFKDVEALPDNDKNILMSVISAYIRDYKAKLTYAS